MNWMRQFRSLFTHCAPLSLFPSLVASLSVLSATWAWQCNPVWHLLIHHPPSCRKTCTRGFTPAHDDHCVYWSFDMIDYSPMLLLSSLLLLLLLLIPHSILLLVCATCAWHLRGICVASAWHHSSCIILASSSAVSPQLARSYLVRLIRGDIPKVRRRIESSVKSPLSQFFLRLSRSLFTSRKRQGLCLYLLERWY